MLTFDALRPLTSGLPPILLLSSVDYGGAGMSALRVLHGLRAAGADAGMLVLDQRYAADGVVTAHVDGKSALSLYRVLLVSTLRRYPNRPQGYELFSINRSLVPLAEYTLVRRAGLIHMHWIAGLVSFPQALGILRDKPVLWTLRDMYPLTGGCHYTAGCKKFMAEGCALCPQLGSTQGGTDLAAENFSAKLKGYANLALHVVTLGQHFSQYATQSLLLGSFPRTTIPNAVETDIFHPMPQHQARALYGLPTDRKIIAFSATDSGRRNKGLHVLLQALKFLEVPRTGEKPLLLLLGAMPETLPLQGHAYHSLGFIDDKTRLAAAYNAADVFVTPSFQEAFGRTTTEAQACGTPGVGFYGTGAEDIIQDGVTGYLAKHPGLPLDGGASAPHSPAYLSIRPDSIEDLADKIQTILDQLPDAYTAMRHACREHALGAYTPELEAARHLQLYRRLLDLPEIPLTELAKS